MKTIISNTTKGSIAGILDEVKCCLEKKEDCVILTADRNVANMEKTVLDTLIGCGAEFRVNVMSFTRFCAKAMGERVKKCLTPEGSVMLLADVIEKIGNEKGDKAFKYYRRVRPDSLANEVYAALTALRNSGIQTDKLNESKLDEKRKEKGKGEGLTSAQRNKIHDLSLMYDGYIEALSDKRDDSSTRLEAFARMLDKDCGVYAGINFFVVGMDDFNGPQLDILRAMNKGVKSLTIGLVGGFSNRNKRIYPDHLIGKINAVCENRVPATFHYENLSPMRRSIAQNLFSYEKLPLREVVDVKDDLVIREALTRQEEVLAVAHDIVKKVMNGARYKDFEVLIGTEEYIPIIRNIFDRYGIVHFVDQKEMLTRQTKVKYLMSALQVVLKNFRNEEVLDFVKNPLFELTLDDSDGASRQDKIFRFENYVLKYNINYNKFNEPFVYGKEGEIAVAEDVRGKLVSTIALLGDNREREIEAIVEQMRLFLDDASDAWQQHVEILSKESQHYKKCAEQVDGKINAILDEISGVLTGTSNLQKIDTILRSMLKTLKIALVPTSLDSVFIGDTSSKFSGNGDLYVLGANSGLLPSENAGGTIITAQDEKLFNELELELYPTQRDRIKKDIFTLVDILAGCKGQLVISYSTSSAGGELKPSTIILQFKEMFKNGKEDLVEKINFDSLRKTGADAKEISALFAGKDKGVHSMMTYAESGRATGSELEIYRSAFDCLSDEDKAVFYKLREIPATIENAPTITKTSLSRLEKYFKCPYAYFLNYTLGIQKREEGDVEAFDAGTILHAVFEELFTAFSKGRVTRDNVEAIASSAFDHVVERDERLQRISEKPDIKRMFERIKNEGIRTSKDFYEISLHSQFKPAYLEAEFMSQEEAERKYGKGAKHRALFDPITLDIDGRKVEIRGVIDRVDTCGDDFLIFDYKTFKSADLSEKDIYHGEKLQLYIYARAMAENTGKKVAGVFYVPIPAGLSKTDEKRYCYNGHVTDNKAVQEKIYGELPQGVTSDFDQNPLPEHYLGEDGFNARGDCAIDIATEGVREIESGYIKPSPLGDCTTCFFDKVCAYKGAEGRKRRNVASEFFVKYASADEDADNDNTVVEGGEE